MNVLDEAQFGQMYAIGGWLTRRLELLQHDIDDDQS